MSNNMAKIADARKTVEQLKLEVNIERMMISKAAADLMAYCETHAKEDPLRSRQQVFALYTNQGALTVTPAKGQTFSLGTQQPKAKQWPTLEDTPFLAPFSSSMAFG
ncbi:unnamed protein product [Menidia menidia]|uniref:Guanine nucleotide-binding protein subunit gamma n=1 Tax=Menidia menidia TaxID=238744 RepID=A0A8S4AIA2_9TELE|nr:unnamed protein product [Menidia menidia]